MNQQHSHTTRHKNLSLQVAKKMLQRRNTSWSHCSCSQCTEGTSMNWVPYLLNLFLEDCKNVQDIGTEFHYSWLITLIAFMGWREPGFVVFCTRPMPAGSRYLLLKEGLNSRHKRENGIIFEAYLCNLQEAINRMWRITPEAVVQYTDIANF
jgi:hypothetical protein